MRDRLNGLLVLPPGQTRTVWDRVKTEPKRPTPRHLQDFLRHLDWLREQGADTAVFAEVPYAKVRHFAAEARCLTANVLSRMVETKRLSVMAALLQSQIARTLDDLADMFVRQMQRMHARAQDALRLHQLEQTEQAGALIALLRETVLACRTERSGEERLAAIESLLLSDADTIVDHCEAHAASASDNHLPFLPRFYRGLRGALLRFLEIVPLTSTSQDRSVEEAIAFVLKQRAQRGSPLRIADDETNVEGRERRPSLDLSFVSPAWWPLVTRQNGRDPMPTTVDRRTFELCLFTQVMNDLRSGDLCIPGSDA